MPGGPSRGASARNTSSESVSARDVGMEGVGRLDEERPLRELQRQARGEHRIDLESQDADAPVEERPGERAAPRTDLDDGLRLPRAKTIENFFDGGRVYEKVLTPASP